MDYYDKLAREVETRFEEGEIDEEEYEQEMASLRLEASE